MQRLEKLYVDIPAVREGTVGSFALAAGLVALSAAARHLLDPYVFGVQFITFFPAVIMTTLISGWRAGAFSVALSAAAAWFFVMNPHLSFTGMTVEQFASLVLFTFVAGIDVALIGGLRFAIERYRELNASLETRIAERTKDLVESQRQLAHAEKLQAIGQLTGGLAHDFNNMLAIVMGSLDLIKRRRADGNADIGPLIDNALEGGRRASELTKRLLAYARNQALAPSSLDINKLTESVAELLRRTLGGSISVECVRAGGLWSAFADPAQLENAIVNLAVNAKDAMPNGGSLTIETANAFLDEDYVAKHPELKVGQYVLVSVTDTGTGMDAVTAARAIEPFFTTKSDGKGTGLGLSQVFGFVKQSGGHLAIYSEVGKGTTIKIYLPRHHGPTEQSRIQAERPSMVTASGECILIVEDDEQVRRMCATALTDLGYAVCESASAPEALEELTRNDRILLMLTDVVMPRMNGRELSEKAKNAHPDLRILYMTGYSRNAIVHNSTLDPGVHLLVKPFTVEQLARKVRELLDGNP